MAPTRPGPWTCAALAIAVALAPAGALAATLTAGDVDDHRNWEHYLDYLDRTGPDDAAQTSYLPGLELEDRIEVAVQDPDGGPIPLARLTVQPNDSAEPRVSLVAGTDGVAYLFPTFDGLGDAERLDVTVRPPGHDGSSAQRTVVLEDLGPHRRVNVTLDADAGLPSKLDLMVALDTTGSMSDELRFLTTELRGILANVTGANPSVDVRLGLTLYRDTGDDYTVRAKGFADDVSTVEGWLEAQRADGGGDRPEAVEQGLSEALDAEWRSGDTARMLLLVGDAPPHQADNGAFLEAVGEAREDGIRISPLAASGVDTRTEYLFRAAEVLTQGRYMFLTDDSGVGDPHKEPSIPCYVVTSLENLLSRVVRSEVTGERIEPREDEIVRQVGNYERGVCLGDPPDAGADEPSSPSEETGESSARTDRSSRASDASRAHDGGEATGEHAETPLPWMAALVAVLAAAPLAAAWTSLGRR